MQLLFVLNFLNILWYRQMKTEKEKMVSILLIPVVLFGFAGM